MSDLGEICVLGLVATAIMDVIGYIRWRLFGVAGLDYAMLGRWLGHMLRGRLVHAAIGRAEPFHGERPLGWALHYGSGVLLAAGFWGAAGFEAGLLTLAGCLAYGAVTVVLPFCILQPCFGLGLAASKVPQVWAARGRSLVSHLSFGLGLYLAVLLLSRLNMAGSAGG